MNDKLLSIKNMVCNRCIMAVVRILDAIGIGYEKVVLGAVHLQEPLGAEQKSRLVAELEAIGFALIDSRSRGVIEKIKTLTMQRARNQVEGEDSRMKLSAFLSDALHLEYTYLSSLFSSIENRTIENYFIEQRIEYVKELLVYGDLTLSEIAYRLEYSSPAHLSGQFKKVTGLTPSHYKKIGSLRRKPLDEV